MTIVIATVESIIDTRKGKAGFARVDGASNCIHFHVDAKGVAVPFQGHPLIAALPASGHPTNPPRIGQKVFLVKPAPGTNHSPIWASAGTAWRSALMDATLNRPHRRMMQLGNGEPQEEWQGTDRYYASFRYPLDMSQFAQVRYYWEVCIDGSWRHASDPRVDTHKLPRELRKAYQCLIEQEDIREEQEHLEAAAIQLIEALEEQDAKRDDDDEPSAPTELEVFLAALAA